MREKLKIIKSKSFWQKGGGEILSFAYTLPFILFLVCVIVSAIQVGVIEQKLSYTAYNCGRAAAVSEDRSAGEQRALELYEALMGDSYIEDGYTPCLITPLDNGSWEKGTYIECTVRYEIDILLPLVPNERAQSVIMMIESGDSGQ